MFGQRAVASCRASAVCWFEPPAPISLCELLRPVVDRPRHDIHHCRAGSTAWSSPPRRAPNGPDLKVLFTSGFRSPSDPLNISRHGSAPLSQAPNHAARSAKGGRGGGLDWTHGRESTSQDRDREQYARSGLAPHEIWLAGRISQSNNVRAKKKRKRTVTGKCFFGHAKNAFRPSESAIRKTGLQQLPAKHRGRARPRERPSAVRNDGRRSPAVSASTNHGGDGPGVPVRTHVSPSASEAEIVRAAGSAITNGGHRSPWVSAAHPRPTNGISISTAMRPRSPVHGRLVLRMGHRSVNPDSTPQSRPVNRLQQLLRTSRLGFRSIDASVSKHGSPIR